MNAKNRMMFSTRIPGTVVRLLCAAAALLAIVPAAHAQETVAAQPAVAPVIGPASPTIESIQAEIARIEAAEGLDATVRKEATEAYGRAIDQLKLAEEWRVKIAAFDQAILDAPARLSSAQQELESTSGAPATPIPPDATLDATEQILAKVNADLDAAKKNQADLQAEAARRTERRAMAPTLTVDAQQRLGKITEELAVIPKEGQLVQASARRVLLEAQRLATQLEVEAYKRELTSYEAERAFMVARFDLASWRIAQTQKLQTELQALADTKRKEEAERAVREAQNLADEASKAYPPLGELAEQNAQLTQERTGSKGLTVEISHVTGRLAEVIAALDRLEQDLASLREKDKVVGKTATYGAWLRRQQASLPDMRTYLKRARIRRSEMADVQLRLIELRELRGALTDVNSGVEEVLANLPSSLSESRRNRIAGFARSLLQHHRDNIDALVKNYDSYFAVMVELETKVQKLLANAEEMDSYIRERVLWIRSAGVIGPRDLTESAVALRWLLGPKAWAEVGRTLGADIKSHPIGTGIWVGLFGVVIMMRRRMARKLSTDAHMPKGAFPHVLRAFAITVIWALIAPGLAWLLGWRLAALAQSEVVSAFAAGLKDMGTVTFTIMVLLGVCLPNGLGRWYFNWRPGTARSIRRWLWWLLMILPISTFLVASVQSQEQQSWQVSLGRIALTISLLTLAVCARRLLRPAGRVSAQVHEGGRHARLWRFRYVGYIFVVGLPIALALMALAGYYHTALHLTGRFAESLWLVAGLLLLNALALRWLDTVYRGLAMQRYRRRKTRVASTISTESPVAPDADLSEELAFEEVSKASLDRANRRSRQLLRSALIVVFAIWAWGIWSSSLPALRVLDRVELFQYTAKVTVPVTTPEGQMIQETIEQLKPVTLADAGLVVLVIILTIMAATDIPAFLEMAVIQRIHRDVGVQYAIIAVLRYVVIVVGTILSFGLLGISWATVQWLVAAMTVGLGFGLQEIFANFISGLIILFERPIRIGDTVTIGETVGTVTKIRIRATTVTDWDRKELIVPNKEFITGRLVNWTLSDKVLRITIRVGIAYGSDTKLAEEVLYKTAREHPLVLNDPAPVVLFREFGDSSLGFDLRIYIGDIQHYIQVWHDLHMAIDQAFRAADITIAFPQTDAHLKTREPLEIRILPVDEAT